jgi:hypothetical protein
MDKSILPGLSKKSWSLPWPGKKKKVAKKKPKTQPGAMDDDAMKRVKDRNAALKEAAGD